MAKAKQYIGESYTDSLGQQWRWDAGKKTYVRNYGTSPMASIKRSWNQKIVPAAQQYAERQTRLTKEALNQKTPNINEYFNSILQERWDNAVTEDEKSSVKDLLAAFNLEEQKGIITEETGAGTTSVIPDDALSWARRGAAKTAGGEVQKKVTQSTGDKEDEKIQSGVIETDDEPLRLRSAMDYDNALKDQATARENWQNMSRWDRQQAEIFAKGSPRKRANISRARGTDVDDLFTKNI